MKKFTLTLIALLIAGNSYAAGFFNPNDFTGTEEQKIAVVSYIKQEVKKTYSAIGMGDPATLRMMESEELKSFKQLIRAENKPMLNNVIRQYCAIGMCNYNTILMMYNEQHSASKKKLQW